ncbi:ABC transporter permease [Paractinoplanes rhizophilus]|uniref:ABC transporter permease n=1 Tax=Paractinoplanes rhizophilus TaxID=1416877 RepID=A0ABW2HKP6_9ACTN|nr:ABC transporter permease [Actinoplanes sp.]
MSIPLPRLTLVELRKLADTRAGLWLLVLIGLGVAGTAVILLGWAPDEELTFAGFLGFGLAPSVVLLPVLGILSMTGEWSQRTALTTFALVPSRLRVIAAKLAAGVLVALATTALTLLLAAAANLIGMARGGDGSWHVAGSLIWQGALSEVLFLLMGMAFGALLLSSPLAIVAFFALPTISGILRETIKALGRVSGWLDLGITSGPLSEPSMTSGEYARLAVSCLVWVALPLVLGSVRILRREVA